MIPSDFIDELLQKVDIVDVIDEAVPLKKGGQNYLACCPFHKEKTPSFTVSPSKQFYHCFSCGAHGSAIGFTMEYNGMSFVDAVEKLADRVGLVVPHTHDTQAIDPAVKKAKQQQKLALQDTTRLAAEYYYQQLPKNERAAAYAQKRGLSQDTIETYQIGYVGDAWQALQAAFPNDYNNPLLEEAGLVINKEGKRYDRFRDRLMFPIRNPSGQVIGFGGRILDKGEPKYLNSPETPLFDKGRELYGLFEAKAAIKQSERVLVVEGYMDVVALAQHGVAYAVATLGTATSADHIKTLLRHSDKLYFCFDGDAAGHKAAWRALENTLPLLKDDKSLAFLFLPDGEDPDSYIRTHGKEAFEDVLVHRSQALSAYLFAKLQQGLDLNLREHQAKLVQQASQLIGQIGNAPALKLLLKQNLMDLTGIDKYDLAQLMGEQIKAKPVKAKNYRLPIMPPQAVSHSLVQIQIMWLLINPNWASYITLPEYWPLQGDYACLADLADMLKSSPTPMSTAHVLELMRDSIHANAINQLMRHVSQYMEGFVNSSPEDEQGFQDGMQRLLKELKAQQIQDLVLKNSTVGLSNDENRLLVALISDRP